jgi:hypothetical protein
MRRRFRLFWLAAALVALATAAVAITAPPLPPQLAPFFTAILQKESAGRPWSIYDNTERRSYSFASRAAAEQRAGELLAMRHNIDVGLYQLNFKYQGTRPGVSLTNIFDPAVNEAVARLVLVEFYQAAQALYARAEDAVRMAVGAYNNGRVRVHNPTYVNAVYRIAGLTPPYASEGITETIANAAPQPQGETQARARFPGEASVRGIRQRFGLDTPTDDGDQAQAGQSRAVDNATEAVATAVGGLLVALVMVLVLVLLAKLLLPLFGKALLSMLKRAATTAALRKGDEARRRAASAATGDM